MRYSEYFSQAGLKGSTKNTFRWVSIPLNAIWYENPKVCSSTLKQHVFKIAPNHKRTRPKGKNPFGFEIMRMTFDIKHQKHFVPTKYTRFFKFAFVRNPWDRMVSNWIMCKATPVKCKGYCKESFSDFVQGISEGAKNIHWEQQISFVPTHHIDFDFIGKMENFQEDWAHVCEVLNIPSAILPVINTNKHLYEHYSTYYDKPTIEVVRELYKKDIEAFDYEFERS